MKFTKQYSEENTEDLEMKYNLKKKVRKNWSEFFIKLLWNNL